MCDENCAVNDAQNQEHQEHEEHSHDHSDKGFFPLFIPAIFSFVFLVITLGIEYLWAPAWFSAYIPLLFYLVAYLPVGIPVLRDAWQSIKKGDIYSEFFLMGIATIGAFAIGEFPEAVAVMLFYSIGELFQSMAVQSAKSNIKSLLDQRPDTVTILDTAGKSSSIKAKAAKVGDIVQLKAGEKLALDGILLSEKGAFNSSALTGESKPDSKRKGETVLAGMINLNMVVQVEVKTLYEDSKLSKILDLVQNASNQKAPTELFIRKLAKVYTPIVVYLAIAICFLPYFFVADYLFADWLYRALIFLVVSCPCALVISIPLGYFGGIGAASKHGILFKGGMYLDTIAKIQHVVTDKTGTLTEGVFNVQEVVINAGFERKRILDMVNLLESKSTHPVATAIHTYVGDFDLSINLNKVEEIAGHGLKAEVDGYELLVGNFKLMDKYSITYAIASETIVNTVIAIAYKKQFVGYITIADKIKDDAKAAIAKLHQQNVKVTMLSGDKDSIVQLVAAELGIKSAFGDLLPEDKVEQLKAIKANNETVAFVGDGVNDAPVVALSDVGLAMGGLGSDATIETADIIIQDDKPSKIPLAIEIGKQTRRIVWQNIALAFGVKAIVLLLGAGGVATMWEAIFADVGVALLAILNAVRIQRMKF